MCDLLQCWNLQCKQVWYILFLHFLHILVSWKQNDTILVQLIAVEKHTQQGAMKKGLGCSQKIELNSAFKLSSNPVHHAMTRFHFVSAKLCR